MLESNTAGFSGRMEESGCSRMSTINQVIPGGAFLEPEINDSRLVVTAMFLPDPVSQFWRQLGEAGEDSS